LFSAKGTVLRADVSGTIKLKCLLSGMPECKLGMNDKLLMEKEPRKSGVTTQDKGITIDDMKFHQCVKLPKFDKERSITFIPPDGAFELMSYRVTQNINLPFKIMPVYNEVSSKKMEIRVKMKSIYDKNLNANNVIIKIPCPKTTASVHVNTLVGRAKYEP
jgi:AP-2 complex subunit mu-1